MILISGVQVKAQIADTTKLTVNKVYSDVKAGMQGLGSALKVGAEHVYHVLAKKQLVDSITTLIIYIIGSIVILLVLRLTIFLNNKEEDIATGLGILLIFITTIFIIYFACSINNCVMGFVNPEYGAIKEIINFVK